MQFESAGSSPLWSCLRTIPECRRYPEIWFGLILADSLIVIAWVWDKLKNGRVHPALGYVGVFVILKQTCEVIAFDSPLWQVVPKELYDLLTS